MMRRVHVFVVSLVLLSAHVAHAQQKALSVFLIGDAGEPALPTGGMKEAIAKQFDGSVPSSFIFLGDNVYPKGLPDAHDRYRKRGEEILQAQLNLVPLQQSSVFFIPGNHDWKRGKNHGLEQILNQGMYIDSLGKSNVQFYPKDGCPGPVEIPLDKDVVLIIIDSQWFLHPWEKPEGDDSPCEIKSAEDAVVKLEDILNRNDGKRVLVAAHHPLVTYGEHGGVFTWQDHIFPLRELGKSPLLYVPMPGLGSIYPLYRKYIGNIQDVHHPVYKRYIRIITEVLKKHPNTLYVNGHDHNLQYSIKDSLHLVTSGAGSKHTAVRKKGYARYAASKTGFVRVDFFTDGKSTIAYFEIDSPAPAYTVHVPAPVKPVSPDKARPDFGTSVRVHASDKYESGRDAKRTLGINYRDEWKQDLTVPVFDLRTREGGLKILQKGGGMQTLSLRMADSLDREYTLRSIEKFPEKAIPEVFRKTFAADLVQDQISAAHPYSALVIPPLADAAGIYHTNPELVFIPDDPLLGVYRREFANTLALYEERPDGDAHDKPYFGNARKVVSMDKMMTKLAEDNDNYVDQKFVLRSRLFDVVIGDWDRHDDQWRWAVFKDKKAEYYRPIPRDRDQAFFLSNGSLTRWISRRWAMPKFEGFHDDVRWVPGFMFNARYFDRSFLNKPEATAWVDEANDLRKALTDAAIDSAIRQFPDEIFRLHGPEIIRKIKARRDRLPEYALEHYKFLSKEVDVPGSNKPEYFLVTQLPSDDVQVDVYKVNKRGEKSDKIYSRLFLKSETSEVRLYGLGGDDVFHFEGTGRRSIVVRAIGGDGKDSVVNRSTIRGLGRSYKIYDQPDGVSISGTQNLADKTSRDANVNTYDRKAFRYPVLAPLITVNYNYDDGVFIGGGVVYTTHGFRKTPFKSKQLFLASFAPLTASYNFRYDGRFSQVFGKWGVEVDADVKAPNFVNNFFGWGNETVFDNEIDDKLGLEHAIDYYRIRLHQIDLRVLLARPLGSLAVFKIGPAFQRVEIEEPRNGKPRLIRDYAATLNEPLFEKDRNYLGVHTEWQIDKRDNPVLTTRGVTLRQWSSFMKGMDADASNYTSHNASLAFYQTFRLPAKVTFALRAGGGINTGNYALWQAQILDGKTELRGYRKTRFYGDRDFFSNNEVRLKVASFRSYVFPASIGISGFFDVGRVWYKDAFGKDPSTTDGVSTQWHQGYGGGVWFTPFNLAVVTTEFAHSKDGNMAYIRLGFLF